MHKLAEKMAECLKAKVEGMGIDNIEGEHLEELGKWVDIIKDIAEYDQAMRIIKAMDEEEEEPEDDGRRGYRGQRRSSRTGRYMRRGYDEMIPYDYEDMSHMRDMDIGANRMYYSGGTSGQSGGNMSGGGTRNYDGESGGMRGGNNTRNYGGEMYYGGQSGRDYREGNSGQARRGYIESKELHKENTPESKQIKMKELEKYMEELSHDVTGMIADASPEEKNLLKAKMQTLTQKIV